MDVEMALSLMIYIPIRQYSVTTLILNSSLYLAIKNSPES